MIKDNNASGKWDADYRWGGDRWDLGGPTPVFQRLLAQGQFLPGRVAILGAGRGYDAREFARHGFEVTAVDFSASAVREMEKLAEPEALVRVLQHDLFTLPSELDHTFDYVQEYVCYCAIDPTRRGEFADLVARLLKPGGVYISLAFPLAFPHQGPPFRVSVPELLDLLGERGFKLVTREWPPDSIRPRKGNEELLIFRKVSN
ncbi:MAG: methyltransferase domain-containing protein [Anaerolineales bacterium]|nr:methyltransferase domain-containing protein [Anaerolineales bacterium]